MAALLSAILAPLFWAGCEVKVTQSNYQKLSFWFDGVPDPNAPADSFAGGRRGSSTQPAPAKIVSQHKPYAENKCGECHKMAGDKPEFAMAVVSCVKCHEKVPTQYRVMHGPVTSGACQWCHAPHHSTLPVLLRTDSARLCTQCHDRKLLSPETAEHQSEKTGCLECHVGHGGTDRRLLKATWAPGSPATQPAINGRLREVPPATRPAPAGVVLEYAPRTVIGGAAGLYK